MVAPALANSWLLEKHRETRRSCFQNSTSNINEEPVQSPSHIQWYQQHLPNSKSNPNGTKMRAMYAGSPTKPCARYSGFLHGYSSHLVNAEIFCSLSLALSLSISFYPLKAHAVCKLPTRQDLVERNRAQTLLSSHASVLKEQIGLPVLDA